MINANLNMAELDDENNPLPSRLNEKTVAYAKRRRRYGAFLTKTITFWLRRQKGEPFLIMIRN